MAKVKLATSWLDACAGCEMSLLDVDEFIIDKTEDGRRSAHYELKWEIPDKMSA